MNERLRQALARREVKRIRDDRRTLSAVLAPIYYKPDEYYLVFTRRTERVREHKGQISFPGGVYQEEDGALLDTALRECQEEIGLEIGKADILGALDDVVTQTSNYIISPFVAFIPWPYDFKVSAEEIEEIIEVPISALLDRNCQRDETESVGGKTVASRSYYYQGRVIWGATARILDQFLDIFAQVAAGE